MIEDKINKNCNIFCHNLYNIGFLMKGKLLRAKSVLWCSHCRIHRYVAAPNSIIQSVAFPCGAWWAEWVWWWVWPAGSPAPSGWSELASGAWPPDSLALSKRTEENECRLFLVFYFAQNICKIEKWRTDLMISGLNPNSPRLKAKFAEKHFISLNYWIIYLWKHRYRKALSINIEYLFWIISLPK